MIDWDLQELDEMDRADLVVLGIDPGGVHVGMAWGVLSPGITDALDPRRGFRIVRTAELTPLDAVITVNKQLTNRMLDLVAVEEYRLYPNKIREQTGSDMPTSQLIGWIRFHHQLLTRRGERSELVLQPASIKQPVRALLRRHQVGSVARQQHTGGHAQDAELHAWKAIIDLVGGIDQIRPRQQQTETTRTESST